jgi:hypothetical protein
MPKQGHSWGAAWGAVLQLQPLTEFSEVDLIAVASSSMAWAAVVAAGTALLLLLLLLLLLGVYQWVSERLFQQKSPFCASSTTKRSASGELLHKRPQGHAEVVCGRLCSN